MPYLLERVKIISVCATKKKKKEKSLHSKEVTIFYIINPVSHRKVSRFQVCYWEQSCSHLAEATVMKDEQISQLFLGGCLFSSWPDWSNIFHFDPFIAAVTLTFILLHLPFCLLSLPVLSSVSLLPLSLSAPSTPHSPRVIYSPLSPWCALRANGRANWYIFFLARTMRGCR